MHDREQVGRVVTSLSLEREDGGSNLDQLKSDTSLRTRVMLNCYFE